jgi:diketogulonate reductase-like aldo/keto reductase
MTSDPCVYSISCALQIFLTTKLPNSQHGTVQNALNESLAKLDAGYIDLCKMCQLDLVPFSHRLYAQRVDALGKKFDLVGDELGR